jgi:hypothetical protein
VLRSLAIAFALLAAAAPAAAAHTDAEIFASNNTATITDPRDPRLDASLTGFARRVERIVEEGGGRPRGSQLLDGVFAAPELTFERSRRFAVDDVDTAELHDIAETVRRRFLQQSVLTFDRLHPDDPAVDAVELEVPGVSSRDLQKGLLEDAEARERLFGGSVTLDRRLLLVAALEDADFARTFAARIGGAVKRAVTRYGDREFVEVATAGRARIEDRRLTIAGTAEDDTVALREGRRLEIDFGDDGVVDFEVSRHRFDGLRVELGEGDDRLILQGADDVHLRAGNVDSVERIDVDLGAGAGRLTVDDLTPAGTFEVYARLGGADGAVDRVTANTADDQEQNFILGVGANVVVLGSTFVQIEQSERTDRVRMNGRGGDDILSASTDLMRVTLDGGDGLDSLFGGPGDDVLLGGDDFDDINPRRGDDFVSTGRGFASRVSWAPGDGSDVVRGGQGTRDSLSFLGSADAERFELARDGRRARFTRDVGNIVMDLDGVEIVDSVSGAGTDLYRVGDMRGTDVDELNASLQPAGEADRVEIEGTDGDDEVTVTGSKVVFGSVQVTGLPVRLGLSFAEVARDTLLIDTLAGDDSVDTSGLAPDVIGLEVR